MVESKEQTLSRAGKSLMLKEPFYGLFLIALDKRWSKQVPTAGVRKQGINYRLDINEKFWMPLSEENRIGLLKHELLHITFFHVNIHEEFPDKPLANIAMDIEVNQYIDPQFLPEGGVTLSGFNAMGMNLPAKAGCRKYYELLQQEKNSGSSAGQAIQAMCDAMNQNAQAGGEGEGQSHDGNGNLLPNHDWKDFEDLSEAEKKLMQSQTEHVLREIAQSVQKSCGNVPGEVSSLLDGLVKEKPKFDWKAYLRRFSGGSQEVYTKKLRRKPNKRFEENPGLKIKPRRHMLLAIDTSGSVNNEELKEFFNEIHHIYKTGSQVTVIQCDTSISDVSPYKPNKQIKIHGRGGTSFQPVIDYYNENFHKYTSLVYFTDGEASTPNNARGRILWVLSSVSGMNEALPGKVIKLN